MSGSSPEKNLPFFPESFEQPPQSPVSSGFHPHGLEQKSDTTAESQNDSYVFPAPKHRAGSVPSVDGERPDSDEAIPAPRPKTAASSRPAPATQETEEVSSGGSEEFCPSLKTPSSSCSGMGSSVKNGGGSGKNTPAYTSNPSGTDAPYLPFKKTSSYNQMKRVSSGRVGLEPPVQQLSNSMATSIPGGSKLRGSSTGSTTVTTNGDQQRSVDSTPVAAKPRMDDGEFCPGPSVNFRRYSKSNGMESGISARSIRSVSVDDGAGRSASGSRTASVEKTPGVTAPQDQSLGRTDSTPEELPDDTLVPRKLTDNERRMHLLSQQTAVMSLGDILREAHSGSDAPGDTFKEENPVVTAQTQALDEDNPDETPLDLGDQEKTSVVVPNNGVQKKTYRRTQGKAEDAEGKDEDSEFPGIEPSQAEEEEPKEVSFAPTVDAAPKPPKKVKPPAGDPGVMGNFFGMLGFNAAEAPESIASVHSGRDPTASSVSAFSC